MQIGKISLHTEKQQQPVEKNNAGQKLSTNPFGVSFKGNVIQADVFQSSANKASKGMAQQGKIFASAIVSGINNFNEALKSRMNAVVSFGKKITTNVLDSIEKFGSTEIKFNIDGIKNKLFPDREYSVKNLVNKPVDNLRTMWTDLSKAQPVQ